MANTSARRLPGEEPPFEGIGPRENRGQWLLLVLPGDQPTLADWVALGVSALASPFLVLPCFACFLTAAYSPDWQHWLLWSSIAALFSAGIPLAYIWAGWRSGWITDLHVRQREQRLSPFLVALLSSALGTAILYRVGAPLPLVVIGIGILCNGIVFALITLRWKISLHPSVYAACVLCASVLVNLRFAWGLLALPVIIWARVHRTRHSLAQGIVAVGIASGVTLAVLNWFGWIAVFPFL